MPKIDLDPDIPETPGDFRTKSQEWYRARLLVFGRGTASAIAKSLITQIRDVVELPFVEEDSRSFLPATHFIIKRSIDAEMLGYETVRIELERMSESFKIELPPTVRHRTDENPETYGIYGGTALFVPDPQNEYSSIPRGRLALEIAFANNDRTETVEAVFMNVEGRTGSGQNELPAAFYRWQDRVAVGFDINLPASFAALSQGDRQLFNRKSIFVVLKRMALDPATLVEGRVSDAALAALSSGDSDIESGLYALVNPKSTPTAAPKLRLNPKTESLKLDVSPICLTPSALSGKRVKASLIIEPNTAYSRLRHDPTNLKNSGYFEILGCVIPQPSAFSDIFEINLHFHPSGQLIAHSLDSHDTSVLLRKSRHWLVSTREDAIVVRSDGPRSELPALDLSRRQKLGLNGPFLTPFTRFRSEHKNVMNGLQPHDFSGGHFDDDYLVVTPRQFGAPLGFFAVPTTFAKREKDLSDPDAAESVVNFRRRDSDTRLGACLDWLDEPIRLVCEDSSGERVLKGYGEYLSERLEQGQAPLPHFQSLRLVKCNDGVFRQHVIEGDDPSKERFSPLIDSRIYRIGPLFCRFHLETTP